MALDDRALAELRAGFGKFDLERSSPMYFTIGRYLSDHPASLQIFDQIPASKRHPTLLFAAVHYLVLDGEGDDLARLYDAPEDRRSLDGAGETFTRFLDDREDEIVEIMSERFVQTNEVNRCVALLPALMAVHRERRKPLALMELGASAGLNLLFDRYRYDYAGGPVIGPPGAAVRLSTHLRGRVPRMDATAPPVEQRLGIDIDPIDIGDDDAVLWLRACIWVGDVARDQRLTAAIALARREWPDVREGNVTSDIGAFGAEISDDLDLCVFSSWLMSWLERDEREAVADAVRTLGRDRPVWWITFEDPEKVPGLGGPEGADQSSSMLGLQRFGPDGTDSRPLAMVNHHGVWLDWLDDATAAW